MKRFIIYSHGFGVRKDDRGLFTDIANSLPEIEHVMFDYNQADEASNTLVATPLDVQARKLDEQIMKIRTKNPDAVIDIVAHSQGCVATALLAPQHVRKVIFLAPPAQFLGLEKKEIYALRPDTVTDPDGTMHMPRRDGSTTIIRDDYWQSRVGVVPINLYNKLAKVTELIIITATQDEVLTDTDFSGLESNVKLIELEANHDFTGEERAVLLLRIDDELSRVDA